MSSGRARARLAALALLVIAGAAWLAAPGARDALGCAFLRHPHTYEADRQRAAYIAALEAASVNALFPGDPVFGLPSVEAGTRANRHDTFVHQAPATVLKAIAWVESNMAMASRSVAFGGTGDALVSFDCGHGIMQVTTGMTIPLGGEGRPSVAQVGIATHYANNIARGAVILVDKWNRAPQTRPVAGTDTNGDPRIVENWYFAVWSYNGFTGPGERQSNHPADPGFGGWPRPAYRCDGTQARNRYPYQELVWGCLASPPAPAGARLWEPIAAALPDPTAPRYFAALSPSTWVFPYVRMDIPTPQPANTDIEPSVPASYRSRALGAPRLRVEAPTIVLRTDGPPSQARATITVRNAGSGILSWVAEPSDGWLAADPPAGVALGPSTPCGGGCSRDAVITITVNPSLLPESAATGTLRVSSPNGSGPDVDVRVVVEADFEVGAPGTSRAY